MVDKRVKKIWETLSFLLEGEGGGEGDLPPQGPRLESLVLTKALSLYKWADRVALRKPVLELAANFKNAPSDLSAAFKMKSKVVPHPC